MTGVELPQSGFYKGKSPLVSSVLTLLLDKKIKTDIFTQLWGSMFSLGGAVKVFMVPS